MKLLLEQLKESYSLCFFSQPEWVRQAVTGNPDDFISEKDDRPTLPRSLGDFFVDHEV